MKITKFQKRAIALAAALVIVLTAAAAVFADEFSSRFIGEGWDFIDNDSSACLIAIRKNDDSWEYWDRAPKRLRDPVGEDWVIETYISETSLPEGEGHHAGLVVYKDSKNWILWGVEEGMSTTANGVLGGVGYDLHSVQSVYNYLRIKKTGNEYVFSCSADGEIWVDMPGRYIDINGYLEGARYGVMGKNWEAYEDYNESYYVRFEYFKENKIK